MLAKAAGIPGVVALSYLSESQLRWLYQEAHGFVLQENPDFYWAHAALAIIYRYEGNNQMADFHQKQVGVILQRQGNSRCGKS